VKVEFARLRVLAWHIYKGVYLANNRGLEDILSICQVLEKIDLTRL
jgi:hypothetical protein